MTSGEESFLHPRDQLLETIERIYRYRMTTTSGGNLSIREPDGTVWITPARIDKGSLRREDMVSVAPDGTASGRHPPSSELPFHLAIYAARPEIRAIVHAHPVALVAFSMCHVVPEIRLVHQVEHVCGNVGFAEYALPGSKLLGDNIAARFREGFQCVILENHGVVTAGASLTEAFTRFETLEFAANTTIRARRLGDVRRLTDQQIQLSLRQAAPLEEFDRPPATSDENELRRQLRDFIRRGYQQRLFISSAGSFSARLDTDRFLITPYRRDRHALDIADFVLIDRGRRERGGRPSRSARMHAAIYRQHPNVGAIVSAYPMNGTAFSVSGVDLDSHTIPESYLLLREITRLPFELPFGGGEEVADRMSMTRPVALMDNDGVLVLGHDILDAFDRLEVLESTAEATIISRSIGEVAPMGTAVIDELKQAFRLKD